jgi:hypothetical protein
LRHPFEYQLKYYKENQDCKIVIVYVEGDTSGREEGEGRRLR